MIEDTNPHKSEDIDDIDALFNELKEPDAKVALKQPAQTDEEVRVSIINSLYAKPKNTSTEEAEKLVKLLAEHGFKYDTNDLVVYLRMIAAPKAEPRLKFPPGKAVVDEVMKLLKVLPNSTTPNDIDACMCMVYHKVKGRKTK